MNRPIPRGAGLATSIEQSSRRPGAPVSAQRGRTLRGVVAGSALALTLSACQWTAPITSMKTYEPGDGVSAQVGSVKVNNLLVVASRQGGPGTVLGRASNTGDQPAQVAVSTVEAGQQGGAGTPVQVPAHGTTELTQAQGSTATTLPSVQVPPGSLVQLLVRTEGGQTVVEVPVLAAEGYYQGYGQAGGTGAPTAPAG